MNNKMCVLTKVFPYDERCDSEASSIARIDPYHLAAMLRLAGIKSFVFARQASARREFSARPCKNEAFYSPETQNGRRVIKVYS